MGDRQQLLKLPFLSSCLIHSLSSRTPWEALSIIQNKPNNGKYFFPDSPKEKQFALVFKALVPQRGQRFYAPSVKITRHKCPDQRTGVSTLAFEVFAFPDALEDITPLSISHLLAAAQVPSLPALFSLPDYQKKVREFPSKSMNYGTAKGTLCPAMTVWTHYSHFLLLGLTCSCNYYFLRAPWAENQTVNTWGLAGCKL